jgi:hypothetical protein
LNCIQLKGNNCEHSRGIARVGGGGQWCAVSGQQSGQQNAYLKNYFLRLTILEIFSIMTGSSINYCNFLKFITYVRDGHCDYSPWAPKT